MEVQIKPIVTSRLSIISTFKSTKDKKESINGHFERMVITVAGLSIATLFFIILVIGIFYTT